MGWSWKGRLSKGLGLAEASLDPTCGQPQPQSVLHTEQCCADPVLQGEHSGIVLLISAKPSAAIGNQLKSRLVFVCAELPCSSGDCCWVTRGLGPTATITVSPTARGAMGPGALPRTFLLRTLSLMFFFPIFFF